MSDLDSVPHSALQAEDERLEALGICTLDVFTLAYQQRRDIVTMDERSTAAEERKPGMREVKTDIEGKTARMRA